MKAMMIVAGLAGTALLATSTPVRAQETPARSIPGITAPDAHPGACVDCHVADPARELDVRLSTLFRLWRERPDPTFLARLQPLAPAGVTLTGAHPTAAYSLSNIPESCLSCHGRQADKAPPLAPMVHLLHLTGGERSVFMTEYQGDCTHCHKLDPTTGEWSVPSGPER